MNRARLLFDLQTTDAALDAARKRMRAIDALLTESEALRAARRSAQQARDRLAQLRARCTDLELESATLDDKIKSIDLRLYGGAVKNPKELGDLQKDAASLRKRKAALDEILLEAMDNLDQAEREANAAHLHLTQVEDGWQGDQASLVAERGRLVDQVAALDAQRAAQRAEAPPADLVMYDRLRSQKRGHAVAQVEDGVCSECGVELAAHIAAQLQRDGTLVACGNCERILTV